MHLLRSVLVVVILASGLGLSQQAFINWQTYIDHIVRLLEENSVLRYDMDWTAFRAQADAIMKPYNLATESERYEVLRQIFALLQNRCDVHSSLIPAAILQENVSAWADGRTAHTPGSGLANPYGVEARMLDGKVAYVSIPRAFSDHIVGVEEAPFEMGIELLRLVRVLDAELPMGWILDLRGDDGGYVETRCVGFHPFLPEGPLFGYAIPRPNGPPEVAYWVSFARGLFIREPVDGASSPSESDATELGPHRYALRNPSAPIAVLVGSLTASAGEYAALSLRQNPHVRILGQPTHGDTTSTAGFVLEDNSLLLVAAQYMVDPSGHVFASTARAPWATGSLFATGDCAAESLQPDVLIALPGPLSAAARSRMTADQIMAYRNADPVLDAALAWLRQTQSPSSVSDGVAP